MVGGEALGGAAQRGRMERELGLLEAPDRGVEGVGRLAIEEDAGRREPPVVRDAGLARGARGR